MTSTHAPTLDPGVLFQAGGIIVNDVTKVVDDPHAKVFVVDCKSKYFQDGGGSVDGVPMVSLHPTDRTLNRDQDYPANAPTVLSFPDLAGWSVLVTGGRYEATIALWTVDPNLDADNLEDEDTSGAARLCGDYPAPCNCDDPDTHNGHNSSEPSPEFLASL